ncbi:MAG: MarR family winged helix-turn-helix transcriptional regulator [Pseudomonadota bacterium]
MTQAQFTVLNHCARLGDGWTPARLANAFQVTKGTLTSTLKRLSAKGFISVRPDPDDGRSKRVFLTDAGRSAREDAVKAASEVLADVPKALPPDRLADVLPKLTALRTWLDNNR